MNRVGRDRNISSSRGAFEADGFTLISGLIEGDIVSRAYRRSLDQIPASTSPERHRFIWDRQVRACFTPRLCSAAREVIGSAGSLRPPMRSYAIAVFPTDELWDWPAPHIDHALEKDGRRSFPPAFRIGCLVYLNDVVSHSGATVVWPGSHIQIENLAKSDPVKYEYLPDLNRDIPKLILQAPVEITAAAGDVLFYHHFLAHAGSMNTGREPRIALSHKW